MTHERDLLRARSLPVLRAMIDAVDHELLQLLARRNGLVTEIAAWKREHRASIRDPQREREIIADRRERAAGLGLPPDAIESMYRLILWASRDRQAALRAEVPPEVEPKTVAVIGASGGMGRVLVKLFADLGHMVMPADLDTRLSPPDAAREADVVIISVPIDVTCEVIRSLGPLVRESAVLMDVTSIKAAPMRAMLEATRASVVGAHPLFGPSVHSLQGQRIVLVPGRGDEWRAWTRSMFAARGLAILEATAEQHDRAMAVVQVLTHFSTEVMGLAMTRLGVDIRETLAFTSPVYLMELLMTARHFAQSADLYASIQLSNDQTQAMTGAFISAAQALSDILSRGDRAAFRQAFGEVHAHFGEFTTQALEQSSFLIDRLVERL
jgi:chorismate mutase/prephenate dehydrogenase